MWNPNSNATLTFRTSVSRLVIFALVTILVTVAVALQISIESNWWIAVGFFGVAFLVIRTVRMASSRFDMRPSGFTYRISPNTRTVEFAEIEKARFESFRFSEKYSFYVQLRNGQRVEMDLRPFPEGAGAALLTALEYHRIPIEQSDTFAAKWAVRRIRDAQAKYIKASRGDV